MGMDLVALKPKPNTETSFHMNWTGWRVFTDLLIDLGCDISTLSGSNDGEEVKEEDCEKWAITIDNNLDRIAVISIKAESYAGGYKTAYKVVENMSEEFKYFGSSNSYLESMIKTQEQIIKPLTESDNDLEWFTSISKYLRSCGGFAQY